MKKTSIVCAVLAGTFGFSTLASAQDWRGGHDRGGDHRAEQRHDRGDRDGRRDHGRGWNDNNRHQQRGYVYNAPNYYGHAPSYHRGGFVPRQYLSNQYYVNNWHSHPGMYAPPYGHQWVNVGGEFLLVALATGLIANMLVN